VALGMPSWAARGEMGIGAMQATTTSVTSRPVSEVLQTAWGRSEPRTGILGLPTAGGLDGDQV
jgi:hypothetical protein